MWLCFNSFGKAKKFGDHWATVHPAVVAHACSCCVQFGLFVAFVWRQEEYRISAALQRRTVLTSLLWDLHTSSAGGRARSDGALSSRILRWLVWLNHAGTTTFIPRLSFWWRWERYGLSILSSGSLALNALCFCLCHFLWSIILRVVISL